MSSGYWYILMSYLCCYIGTFSRITVTTISVYIYRRGLRSCLSLQGGKFEGQEREISNEYESHAFFILCLKLNLKLVENSRVLY